MKQVLLATLMFFFVFSASMGTVHAVGAFDEVCADNNNSSVCKDIANRNDTLSSNPITGNGGIFFKAINLIAFLTGVASVLIIIIGGIKYVFSTGDPSKLSSAKDTILYAVIGVFVSLTARGIVLFLVNRLN